MRDEADRVATDGIEENRAFQNAARGGNKKTDM